MSGIRSKEANERNKQKNVANLMKQFNTYFKEGKYKEAEMYAMLAHDIDPDNHIVSAAVGMAKMQQGVRHPRVQRPTAKSGSCKGWKTRKTWALR